MGPVGAVCTETVCSDATLLWEACGVVHPAAEWWVGKGRQRGRSNKNEQIEGATSDAAREGRGMVGGGGDAKTTGL